MKDFLLLLIFSLLLRIWYWKGVVVVGEGRMRVEGIWERVTGE